MALAIDASTPAGKGVAPATSITSNTFSPPANSVIIVLIAAGGGSASVQSVSSMTDNLGGHLSWALITGARSNTNNVGNLGGSAEVWYASCPSAQTNMTVTANFAVTTGATASPDSAILPLVFTGAKTTQTGAAATDPQASVALPSKAVTTTGNDSRVVAAVVNYTNATAPTVGTNQTTTFNGSAGTFLNATDAEGFWFQMQNANTATSGTSVTINDTAPSVQHNMVVVEVLAAVGGAAVVKPPSPRSTQAVHRAAIW